MDFSDPTTVIIFAIIGAFIGLLVAAQSLSIIKRKNAGKNMLALHPDAARVYTRLGGPMAGALGIAAGAQPDLSITSVDGKTSGTVIDQSGWFCPLLQGQHHLKLLVTVQYPGVARRIITGEVDLTLSSYQCIYIGYDKDEKRFFVQDLGSSHTTG